MFSLVGQAIPLYIMHETYHLFNIFGHYFTILSKYLPMLSHHNCFGWHRAYMFWVPHHVNIAGISWEHDGIYNVK
jgi:hypothetical protein